MIWDEAGGEAMDGMAEPGDEDRLYGLMEVAGRQQALVQAALEGLAAERAALAREREALGRQGQKLEAGTRAAVRAAVADSLAGAAREGAVAVEAATGPLLAQLLGVASEAVRAEAALRRVVLWAGWRLLGWLVAVGAATAVVGWLMGSGVLWWDARAVAAAQAEKARLQGEVTALEANQAAYARAGVLQKLTTCGPKGRVCLRVDESAGTYESQGHSDYRVILGY